MAWASACMLCMALTLPAAHAAQPDAHAAQNGTAWRMAQTNPAELMRQVLGNELANSYGRRLPLRYCVRKTTEGSDTTKQIIETADGGVARLVAIDGKPLSASKERAEVERLRALEADPAIEAHRLRHETRDAERIRKFMKLLPKAFLYKAAGVASTPGETLIRLTFAPNPKFSPPDFESRMLTGIQGELWIDPEAFRIVRVDGRIFRTVDFGWGILGSISPGGTLSIEQARTGECGWQLSHLILQFVGKALLVKSIHIQVDERATRYRPVPPQWTYREAVRTLLANSPTSTSPGGLGN